MHSFGIKNKIDEVISLCLGPVEVSVEEMVTAYTAFSNKGVRVDPLYVTRIEDNLGNVIAEFTPSMTEVFSEQAYYRIFADVERCDRSRNGRSCSFPLWYYCSYGR